MDDYLDPVGGNFNYNSGQFAAKTKVLVNDRRYVIDMYYKMDGEEDGELSYGDFILRLINELQVNRRYGYVRLFLYPTKATFCDKFIAIFIRKKDLYVVGLQDHLGVVFEVGRESDGIRYFINSSRTGFGEQYYQLFGTVNQYGVENNGRLSNKDLGFQPLNEAILNIINEPNPLRWNHSVGVFAMMWSECCRFKWVYLVLKDVMAQKTSLNTDDKGRTFLRSLPKFWRDISECARKDPVQGEPLFQPQQQWFTDGGARKLKRYKQWAIDSLFIQTLTYQTPVGPIGNWGRFVRNYGQGGGGYGGGGGGRFGHGRGGFVRSRGRFGHGRGGYRGHGDIT